MYRSITMGSSASLQMCTLLMWPMNFSGSVSQSTHAPSTDAPPMTRASPPAIPGEIPNASSTKHPDSTPLMTKHTFALTPRGFIFV